MKAWLAMARREWRFVAVWLAAAVCVAGALSARVSLYEQPPTGWRRIDPAALDARLRDGTLVRHPALYFREAEAGMP